MSKLKIEIAADAYSKVGVAIKDVEFGTVVVRDTHPNAAQYLVASPMNCSGQKALVTLGGGTLKEIEQNTRVFPIDATLTVGTPKPKLSLDEKFTHPYGAQFTGVPGFSGSNDPAIFTVRTTIGKLVHEQGFTGDTKIKVELLKGKERCGGVSFDPAEVHYDLADMKPDTVNFCGIDFSFAPDIQLQNRFEKKLVGELRTAQSELAFKGAVLSSTMRALEEAQRKLSSVEGLYKSANECIAEQYSLAAKRDAEIAGIRSELIEARKQLGAARAETGRLATAYADLSHKWAMLTMKVRSTTDAVQELISERSRYMALSIRGNATTRGLVNILNILKR